MCNIQFFHYHDIKSFYHDTIYHKYSQYEYDILVITGVQAKLRMSVNY